jgi:hypothetical protein
MLGSTLSLIRRNALGLTAIALVAVPSSYALASPTSEKTTRICVAAGTGALRYVKTPGHCRSGERSFFVSRRGVQGLRGSAGLPGAAGKAGAVGAAGVDGSRGPAGALGLAGANGALGAPGTAGTNGTQGVAGTNGTQGVAGTNGTIGTPGTPGTAGANGTQGTPGTPGTPGLQGVPGTPGTAGANGTNGTPGAAGTNGTNGTPGVQGDPGIQGPAGPAGSFQYAEFYAVMPSDNAATVASGTALLFPQDGPNSGLISRGSSSTFVLTTVGTYRVAFSASITEAGQLQLALNNVGIAYAAFGRATGTSLIAGEAFITTTSASAVLSVKNASAGVVTLTPLAGGPVPVTAYLIIQKLS